MDRRETVDERVSQINKNIRDIQESIDQNRKEQKELQRIMEDTMSLKRQYNETHESIAHYSQGTDFGRRALEMQAERDRMYKEMITDIEMGIEEKKAELRKLFYEEREYEDEIRNLRRNY